LILKDFLKSFPSGKGGENNKDLKFNYLNLILFDFKSWEIHENIWENIFRK